MLHFALHLQRLRTKEITMNHATIITNWLPEPTQTIRLNGINAAEKRREILEYFNQTWDLYESLFDCLSDERAYFDKAISLRHPLIFYFGHTATFYINKLMAAGLISERIDDGIEAMLAIGVDEMSWDDLDNSHYSWPGVAQLRDYRGKVRTVLAILSKICRWNCRSVGKARRG